MYKIIIQPNAEKKLKKLPQSWRSKISRTISMLAVDPYAGKKLHGDHEGKYSVRAWPYRVLYTIEDQYITVYILDLGHRKDIYR